MRITGSTEATARIPQPASLDADSLEVFQDAFIRAWIDIAKCMGFAAATAEVHALLYICGCPLCTDDVMARLNMSRGNVSICLRSLRDCGVIRRVHFPGVRRDYFESPSSIQDVFAAILTHRVRAHLNPALTQIRQCMTSLSEVVPKCAGDRAPLTGLSNRLWDFDSFIASIATSSKELVEKTALPPRKNGADARLPANKKRIRQ